MALRFPSEIVAVVVVPLFYLRWYSREPLDDRLVEGVVERAVPIHNS